MLNHTAPVEPDEVDPSGVYPRRSADELAAYLVELAGLTRRQAHKVAACFELARPYASETIIKSPAGAARQCRAIARLRKKHLIGLYLNAQNGLILRETLSVGSLNTTRTVPREILLPAVANSAFGFILAHNHPSGCVEPSDEDIEFTRAVGRASALLGIELYDHLIVARGGFTSLRERGLLA